MSKRPHLSIKLISLGQIMPSIFLYPIRIGWQTVFEQNNKRFYMHITEGHESSETEPGYRSQLGSNYSNIEVTSSLAITKGVQFRPFVFKIEKFLLYVISLEIGSNIEMMGASIRYMSSFIGEFKKKRALFVQTIEKDN
ncbi:19026_t:CDS:2, partial [Gigaspora rosea]